MTLIALIIALIFASVLLIQALTTNTHLRVFQVVINSGYVLTCLLVLCDVNKIISGVVLAAATVVMVSMYYSNYHYNKQQTEK
jgi:hypothetical protein